MEQTYKRMSRVENFFSMLLTKADVSDNLFFGNLPAAIKGEWNDMVLVDVQPIHDYDGRAACTVNIFLYAKSTDTESSKPVKKLNKMEVAFDKAIAASADAHYVLTPEWRDQGYDADSKYFYNVVNVSVTIR